MSISRQDLYQAAALHALIDKFLPEEGVAPQLFLRRMRGVRRLATFLANEMLSSPDETKHDEDIDLRILQDLYES